MSQFNRANVSIEPGRIDRVSFVQLAEDHDRGLLSIVASEARIILEVNIDDLWKIATECRNAVKRREEERRMEDQEAEVEAMRVEPISDMRALANDLLRGMAR